MIRALRSRPAGSLRRRLFLLMVAPLVAISLVSAVIRYHQFGELSQKVYDNTLYAVALTISRDVVISEGELLKAQLLSALTRALGDTLYYRIRGPNDAFVTGYSDAPDLPAGIAPPEPGRPVVFDSRVGDMPVRALVLRETVADRPMQGEITVEVWTTVNQRRALSMQLLGQSLWSFAAIILAAALLVWFGIHSGLGPLRRLEEAVLDRSPQDLRPLAAPVPQELSALVGAMNGLFARLNQAIALRDAFISDAAHQVRTPIAAIQAQAEASLTAPDEATLRARVARLTTTARHAGRLTNQLLSLERVRGRDMRALAEPVEAAPLLAQVTRDFAGRVLAAGTDVSFETTGVPRPLLADPVMLSEALTNLLDNAALYGRPGGSIAVGVAFLPDRITVEVADDGPGIPPGLRERVFDRFYRVHEDGGDGCGLGLAIVRDVARAHGGDAEVAEGNTGCRIRMTFPAPMRLRRGRMTEDGTGQLNSV